MFTPADELTHPQGDAWWLDLATPTVALRAQLVAPPDGLWRYWACVERDGELVAVIDDEVPPPSRPGSLELRTEGLWTEFVVETAFDHVSVGCEAFGLRLDPPLDPTGVLVGDRVPFGLDLGFETDGKVVLEDRGYLMPCRVDGLILVGADEITIDGANGRRGHLWREDVGATAAWLMAAEND